MKILKLSNSDEECLVDDDVWLRFCRYKWRLKKSGTCSYVVRSMSVRRWENGKRIRKTVTIRLHRVVMDCPEDKEVHHKDGNVLDNRRESLEIVDPRDHKSDSACKRWTQ